jgi:hypothetical protein
MPGRLAIAPAAIVVALLAAPAGAAAPTPGLSPAGENAPSNAGVPGGMAPTGEDRPVPSVIVQRSIRGVQLGMSPARVREVLDRAPSSSRTDPHPILERTKTWTFGALRVVFDGVKAGARVISVSTTSRSDRTSRGVGVGSSEQTVRRRVKGAGCHVEYGYRGCWVGKELAGEAVTYFSISSKGKVWRISLARVID